MWFALTVKPNHEHAATRALLNQDFDAYLPVHRVRRQWSDRIKEIEAVLFPGYVFCRFDPSTRLRVLQAPGVRSIVGAGKDAAPVDDAEIDSIRALIASRRPILPWPFLRAGERVAIRSAQVRPNLMEESGKANLPFAAPWHRRSGGGFGVLGVYDAPELTRTVRVDVRRHDSSASAPKRRPRPACFPANSKPSVAKRAERRANSGRPGGQGHRGRVSQPSHRP
jgi:transcription antitermination factor NusG